jgi:hypothetical protein
MAKISMPSRDGSRPGRAGQPGDADVSAPRLRDGYSTDMHQQPEGPLGRRCMLDFGIKGRLMNTPAAFTPRSWMVSIRMITVAEVHFEAGYVPAGPRYRPARPSVTRGRARFWHGRPRAFRWGGCWLTNSDASVWKRGLELILVAAHDGRC